MSSAKIDTVRYEQNRRQIPNKDLEPYAGNVVAFSADGTHVVAHGPDHAALGERLDALGIDISEVVWEYLPGPEDHTWL